MNIKNYISGELRQEYQYKSFVPSMINHTFTWDDPHIMVAGIIEPLSISKQTANTIVKDFVAKGILVEETGFLRNKIFSFKRYVDIFSKS